MVIFQPKRRNLLIYVFNMQMYERRGCLLKNVYFLHKLKLPSVPRKAFSSADFDTMYTKYLSHCDAISWCERFWRDGLYQTFYKTYWYTLRILYQFSCGFPSLDTSLDIIDIIQGHCKPPERESQGCCKEQRKGKAASHRRH